MGYSIKDKIKIAKRSHSQGCHRKWSETFYYACGEHVTVFYFIFYDKRTIEDGHGIKVKLMI